MMIFLENIRKMLIRILCFLIFWEKTVRNSMRCTFIDIGIIKSLIKIYRLKKINHNNQKYYLSIIATVRNEDIYLAEWIEYYKIMGVEHFYIYDNESTDNTKEVLKPYIKQGLVTNIFYPGENKQREIYNHALDNFRTESTWLAPIDIDEFILPKTCGKISDYLKKNEKHNQIIVNWYFFGDSGHKTKPEGLVIENFIYREKTPSDPTKAIVKSSKTIYISVHKHSVLGKSKNCSIEEIQCNHYFGKSEEEYLNKKAPRGRSVSNHLPHTLEEFHAYNKNNVLEKMPEYIVDEIKQKLRMI